MQRNSLSLLLVCMVFFSMPVTIRSSAILPTAERSYSAIPEASSTEGAIPQVGSVLYYRVITEKSNVTEESIIRLKVTDKPIYGITYEARKFFQDNETSWEWAYTGSIYESYYYNLFNHTYTIDKNIISMASENISENVDALFLNAMNSSIMIHSEYSDIIETWHYVELECLQDDNVSTPVKIIWMANKTTGLVTYYEQQMEDTRKVELIGFEIPGYTFQQPDTFGLKAGDTIDLFRTSTKADSSKESEETFPDDRYEENDQYTSPYTLKNTGATRYTDLMNRDDDYFQIYMVSGANAQIYVYMNLEDYFYLQQVNPTTGDLLGNEDGTYGDGNLQINIIATSDNWYCFRIIGENDDHGYTLEVSINGDYAWDDWCEENDEYYNARYLDLWMWDHYWGLVQKDADYYKFTLDTNQDLKISLSVEYSAAITLQDIHPTEGYIIQSDSSTENGKLELQIHASAGGDFVIAVIGDNTGDWYNFEFWSETDDSSSDDSGQWIRQTVKFVYINPHLNYHGIIVGEDVYKDPRMWPDSLIRSRGFNIWSYVNISNVNAVYGQFFYRNLDWESTAFDSSLRVILTKDSPEGPGLSIMTHFVGIDWAEYIGMDQNGYQMAIFVQQLKNGINNIGTVRYMSMMSTNVTTNEKFKEYTMVIDCSAGGMISTSPSLGVVEGDWWTYLVEEHHWENKWGTGESSYNYEEDVLHYVKFTVTHIFAGNYTVMAVLGRMEMWSSDEPEPKIKGFEPFLVWDTNDPISFMSMSGHTDHLERPPILLPKGVDWSTQGVAMDALLYNLYEGATIRTNYQSQAIRIHASERYENEDESKNRDEIIILETQTDGVVTHLTRNANEYYHYSDESFSSGFSREEKFDAFLYDAVFASSLIEPPTYTNLVPTNVFVWERSRYRPYEQNNNPAHKEYSKIVLTDVISSYDGAVVFIGSRFWKGWEATVYQPETWTYWNWETNSPIDTGINRWLLGSIRPGNLWSWAQSQFYEKTITDFTPYKSVIAGILNVMLPLPATITIDETNIETEGTTFQVSVDAVEGMETMTYVMRWAMNGQGVMRDMFQGVKYENDTWREWERQVLVECPSTTQLGEYFFTDIPSNYVPWEGTDTESDTTSTDSNPFDFEIPTYPPLIISIFALFGVIIIIRRMRKQR